MENEKRKKINFKRIVFFTLVLLIVNSIISTYMKLMDTSSYNMPEKVEYNEFYEALKSGLVDTVYIDTSDSAVRYTLLNEVTRNMDFDARNEVSDREKEWFKTDYPGYEDFRKECLEYGAQVQIRSWVTGGIGFSEIVVFIQVGLSVGIFVLFYKSIKGMNKNLGILGGRTITEATLEKPVKFDDIIGHDEVIEDIKHNLKIMQTAHEYEEMDVKPPKGILLIGPPGTGKTMIAKACATEAGLKFFDINSSNIIDKFVGQGASTIRSIFKQAKENAPCILFFDEIDAIGSKRTGEGSANSEYKQTLDALLQEMDGFGTNSQVYMMAATNLFDTLDDALIRPGRFDKKIIITPPRDVVTRKKMLDHYLHTCKLSDDVDTELIARQLSGMSGADISSVANEAKLIAISHDDTIIHGAYLEEAIDKIFFNGNRTKNEYKKDTQIVAYHESGHALSMLLNDMPIARMSVIPNTSGVGGMVVNSDKDSMFITKNDYIKRIKSLYAGRIAEELIFGPDEITTGASNDLEVATRCIDEYVNKYSFDTEFSYLFIDKNRSVGGFNSGYDRKTYDRMNDLAKKLFEESKSEIEANIDILEALAKKVLDAETLDSDEIKEVYEDALKQRESVEVSIVKETLEEEVVLDMSQRTNLQVIS